jgi:hypothetical protein
VETAAEMAGFVAAEQVLVASGGGPMLPLLDHESPGGKRHLIQIVKDRFEDAAAEGMKFLSENPAGASRAVLAVDAYVALGEWRTEAVVLHAHLYTPTHRSFIMALPYRSAKDAAGFAVHRPKFLSHEGPPPDHRALASAFFRGARRHERGWAAWEKHFDGTR